jgi:O-antigen ligase
MAWRQFLDSPLWGTWFTAAGVQKFTLYTVGATRNLLPTHSDVMDLLANGGMLGVGLWALGLIRILQRARQRLLTPRRLTHPWAPLAHTLAVVSLAAVVTYSFNPVMLQPGMSYLMWMSFGVLLGLTSRAGAEKSGARL